MARGGRLISLVTALALMAPAGLARADDDPPPFLRIPGLPPIPMPPGTHVYGPGDAPPTADAPPVGVPNADLYHEYGTVTPGGGRREASPGRGAPSIGGRNGADMYGGTVIGPGGVLRPVPDARNDAAAKPKALTPEERQTRIRKALMPKPPLAVARQQTLDDLYAKLAQARDEDESKGLASLIAAVWMRSGSDTADLLMSRAEKAIGDKNYPIALEVLDRLVVLRAAWPEAWNKRAATRYLAGDLNGAMADVEHVLKLDPKHFAALSGMATILKRTGFDKRALQIYRRELSVYPHQPEIEKIVKTLALQVEGQGI